MENESILVVILAVITAASNVWAGYEARQANKHYAESNRIARGEPGEMGTSGYRPSRWPQTVMLALTVLVWTGVIYGIYDRHSTKKSATHPPTVADWNEAMAHLTPITGDFKNQSIVLDGYRFTNCSLENTVLIYEGKLPVAMECQGRGSAITIETNNPVVYQTMEIMNTLMNLGAKVTCDLRTTNAKLFP